MGNENVIATDIRMPEKLEDGELFEILDVMDYEKMRALVEKYQVDTLIHLASRFYQLSLKQNQSSLGTSIWLG